MAISSDINFETVFFSDEDKALFYKVMQSFAKEFGCFYLGYFFENLEKKVRLGFSSNPDWQDIYVKDHLIDSCHLWKSVTHQFIHTKREFLIMPWETVTPELSIEKDILLYRTEMGIGVNGISFCSQKNDFREYFAIAPENNTPSFLQHISRNIQLIKSNINFFRKKAYKHINI